MTLENAPPVPPMRPSTRRQSFQRHSPFVRIGHWINAGAMIVLIMSGLQIFNAHPALSWGEKSNFDHPFLAMGATQDDRGNLIGVTSIAGHDFITTGFLGASRVDGDLVERGFPAWVTLPAQQFLAMGRRWHFFFAWVFVLNGIAFWVYAFLSGHLRRDLVPTGGDLRGLFPTIIEHVRLRFPQGESARHYNPLQKLSYLAVAFGLGPLALLTGLTMSPTMNAAIPELLSLFGGRQSARTIHFLCAFAFIGFIFIHLAMVVLSGFWNNLRSMITGRYVITTPALEGSDSQVGRDHGKL